MNKTNVDLSEIDTVILVGGLGTRLQPVLKDKPKCLAPINGKPFIDILLDDCINQGLRRFILCVGYLKEQVIEHLSSRIDCEIIFSVENKPLGTYGAIINAEKHINCDQLLVLNGDTFVEINYNKLIEWHNKKNSDITIVLNYLENIGRYGLVTIDSNSKINGFIEKGTDSGAGWINVGVYLINKLILKVITVNQNISFEYDIFPDYIGKSIYGFRNDGNMIDIGIPVSYDEAQLKFK